MNRAFIGRAGSGKTFALQSCARNTVATSAWRVLVLDCNGEWPNREAWKGSNVRPAIVDRASVAAEHLARGAKLVVLRPDPSTVDWQAPNPYARIADAAAGVAIDGPPTVLVLPEAHWSAREGYPLPANLGRIAHQWRHVKALVWCDTQNPADVKKELFRACPLIWIFRTGGWQDFPTFRAIGGAELERAARALVEHCAAEERAGRDARGWHLRARDGEMLRHDYAYRLVGSRVVRAMLPSAR